MHRNVGSYSNFEDLKKSFKIIIIPILIGFIFFLSISKPLLTVLISYYDINIVALSVTESLNSQIKFSFILALILLFPFLMYGIYYFIRPAYNLKGLYWRMCFSVILGFEGFILGVSILSKIIMQKLSEGSLILGYYSLSNSLSFAFSVGFATAISLQLILLLPFLKRSGFIKLNRFSKDSLLFVIITFFMSAFITPPDLFSTFFVMIPISFSYVCGYGISKLYTEDIYNVRNI